MNTGVSHSASTPLLREPASSATTLTTRSGRPWRRWAAAVGLALVPVVATAVGSAAGQVAGLGEVAAALVLAVVVAGSAVVGLLLLRSRRPGAAAPAGLGRPRRLAAVGWCAPLLLTVVVAAVTQPVRVSGPLLAAYAVLVVCVALNEEVWFRGVLLAVLRPSGLRAAVVGSTVLFAVLHLANLAGGQGATASVLQLVFAALFGLVAAEVAVVTRSLWPAIAWHALWDLASYAGGNPTTVTALTGLAVVCAVMLALALVLWRRGTGTGR